MGGLSWDLGRLSLTRVGGGHHRHVLIIIRSQGKQGGTTHHPVFKLDECRIGIPAPQEWEVRVEGDDSGDKRAVVRISSVLDSSSRGWS